MTTHRADCADCPWTFEDEDLIEVSDELERHSQKEHHHVDLERAVATDGGEDIEGLAPMDGVEIAEFHELAEERSRGVGILDEPQDVDLTLVELSASYLDPDGILRTFSITADGFDPDDYEHEADDEDDPEVVTDGGVPAGQYRHQCVDAIRTHVGVGDQNNTCENGTPGCPGPDAANGQLPCSACFLRGGAD